MYRKAALFGNICYRFFTLLSLVLTVYFFFIDTGAGMVQKAIYAMWMAVCVFSSFKVISDIIGGQHRRQQNFVTMMEQWEQHQGGPKTAVRTFLLVSIGTALAKLVIPVLLLVV